MTTVKFQAEDGTPLEGTLFLLNDKGEARSAFGVPTNGMSLDDDDLSGVMGYRAEVDGYYPYTTYKLLSDNLFILSKKPNLLMYAAIGLIGGLIIYKLM